MPTGYYNQEVPLPDLSDKLEWLNQYPQFSRICDKKTPAELMSFLPFLSWYLPKHIGTIKEYYTKVYREKGIDLEFVLKHYG